MYKIISKEHVFSSRIRTEFSFKQEVPRNKKGRGVKIESSRLKKWGLVQVCQKKKYEGEKGKENRNLRLARLGSVGKEMVSPVNDRLAFLILMKLLIQVMEQILEIRVRYNARSPVKLIFPSAQGNNY